jgi:lipoprotein-anchoring transpeptidase ErfK/SrfK
LLPIGHAALKIVSLVGAWDLAYCQNAAAARIFQKSSIALLIRLTQVFSLPRKHIMRRHFFAGAARMALLSLAVSAAIAVSATKVQAYEYQQMFGQTYGGLEVRPRAAAPPRELVAYNGHYAPGTIVISTEERSLYFILPGNQAVKYGIGVGRPGFEWGGTRRVSMKREWPSWRPPAQMRRRRPDLPSFMPGGPENPLGARAMYLSGTLYRIHGSNEPQTIGQAVSSGCIRMTNEDVMDLYEKVKVGTRVIVLR